MLVYFNKKENLSYLLMNDNLPDINKKTFNSQSFNFFPFNPFHTTLNTKGILAQE